MKQGRDPLEPIVRRMGEQSWLILSVLEPVNPLPGIEILRRVERLLEVADYPTKTLDPSTLHYALKRMEDDGLVRNEGQREVEVPGPRGTKRREPRAVYTMTGLGAQVLERKRRLDAALAAGGLKPVWEGNS